MDILANKAPKGHKELMTDHGFDPQTATTAEFVEICERAETKEALQTRDNTHYSDDESSEDDEHRPKKPRKKAKTSSHKSTRERSEFYCKEHGPNPTHNSSTCKVLMNKGKDSWKKKDTSESKYSDYKAKYKKKHQELNLLQQQTKKEKAKWTKAYKNLKSKEADKAADKDSDASEEPKRATAKSIVKERPDDSETDSDSSSAESSSSSESESE
jgi:hypothetical protein